MFYIMYLNGLCQRRHWPDPLFDCHKGRSGYSCTVRVNNREYTSQPGHESDELARNDAATRAYMICRNFSANDGMFPGQRQGQAGVVQGKPVAIGTGRGYAGGATSTTTTSTSTSTSTSSTSTITTISARRASSPARRGDDTAAAAYDFDSGSSSSQSGASSPRSRSSTTTSSSSGAGGSARRRSAATTTTTTTTTSVPTATAMPGPPAPPGLARPVGACFCSRGPIHAFGRCALCLRENGWC